MQPVHESKILNCVGRKWGNLSDTVFCMFPVTHDMFEELKRLFSFEAYTEHDLYVLNGVLRTKLSLGIPLPEPAEDWRRLLEECLIIAGERHIDFYWEDTEELDKQTRKTV